MSRSSKQYSGESSFGSAIDKIKYRYSKNVNRQPNPIYMARLSQEEKVETAKRLKERWYANGDRMAGTFTSIKNTPVASIELRRSGLELEPIAASKEVKSTSVQLKKVDDFLRLDFVFAEGDAEAKVILRPSVLERIRPDGSVISLTYLEARGMSSLAIFVDDVLSDLIPTKKGTETIFRPDRDYCQKQSDGSSRSPIKIFVFHSDGTVSTPYDPNLK